jgi:hypothetical protein
MLLVIINKKILLQNKLKDIIVTCDTNNNKRILMQENDTYL